MYLQFFQKNEKYFIHIYNIFNFYVNKQYFTDHLTSSNNVEWKIKQKYITNGPIYTYLKTDKNANIKWSVRHYISRNQKY